MGVLEIQDCRLNLIMESMPKNLKMGKPSAGNVPIRSESVEEMHVEFSKSLEIDSNSSENNNTTKLPVSVGETKIQLSFSVDRLLNSVETRQTECKDDESVKGDNIINEVNCFDTMSAKEYGGSCRHPNCSGLIKGTHAIQIENSTFDFKRYSVAGECNDLQGNFYSHIPTLGSHLLDFKSIVRPTPIRAISNRRESVPLHPPYPTLATSALLRFQQQQKTNATHSQILTTQPGLLQNIVGNGLGFKSFHSTSLSTQSFVPSTTLSVRFPTLKTHSQHLLDISMSTASLINHHRQHHSHIAQNSCSSPNPIGSNTQLQLTTTSGSSTCININNNNNNGISGVGNNGGGKRKRSWSRAVFSNLQRKGLEIQFQQQKYITKPDRRKLAARLNLTDAQVKVWFQNRRMKWRHTRENLKSGQEKQIPSAASSCATTPNSKEESATDEKHALDGYSSDDSSCGELSENDDEIDVVQ